MPKNFRRKPITELRSNIKLTIDRFNKIDLRDPMALAGLIQCQDELESYKSEKAYKELSKYLKEKIAHHLNLVTDHIQRIDDFQIYDLQQGYIQIPNPCHIEHMHDMPAGADENQDARLQNMIKVITSHSNLPIITTEKTLLSNDWLMVLQSIDNGHDVEALLYFDQIAEDDMILQPLLIVHTREYIHQLIKLSIEAQRSGLTRLNSDIVITPKTFELLIKDLATTLENPSPVQFSFGLPSHHAYSGNGSGFCLLNKTAIIMVHHQINHQGLLKHMVIGTDVNRDNGLCNIMLRHAKSMIVSHIDIFDPRVYPQQDKSDISEEFAQQGVEIRTGIQRWTHENLEYFAADLSKARRQLPGLHPALHFALITIEENIEIAKTNEGQIALYLPCGWDSHENETAPCGKFLNGRQWLTKAAARNCRFNDRDLSHFYERIFQLYTDNKECFAGIYWGLEGGYDKKLYENQILILMNAITENLIHTPTESFAPRL